MAMEPQSPERREVLCDQDGSYPPRSGFCIALATAGTAAAQNPFAGTWKLNQDKSQLAGDTMKFGPAAGDAIELTAGGVTYSFRVDGKNYAMPSGNIAIWRQTSPTSWTTEYRKTDGKLLSSDTWKLSADGKKLSVTTSGVKADGDLYTDTAEYERTAGTSGLMGAWKSTAGQAQLTRRIQHPGSPAWMG